MVEKILGKKEMNKNDLKFEFIRGTGPGGQHKNKTCSACRVTHIPTGITAYADERSQKHSKKMALKELESRVNNLKEEEKAKEKKAKRDYAIHNTEVIRTYDFKHQTVKDHRSKKTASIKDILGKGKLDLLR